MEIYIIRHGETLWNKDKKLQGSTDVELSDKGRALAVETSENVKDIPFDRVFSSPLKRAYETACIIKGDRNIEICQDDRIRELNFGVFEGQNMLELKADPECSFRHFFDKPECYTPTTGGESLEKLCERAAEFMKEEIEPLASQCQRIMIVAHGAVNKAMMTHVKRHTLEHFWSGGLQRNCGVIILDYTDGTYRILDENKVFYEYRKK